MRILVADDDQHLRAGLAELLEGQGYDCVTAADGVEALGLAHREVLDLCILDVMMPRMDGMQLCLTLRKRCPTLPILFLTALDKDIDQVRGLDVGADDYINKPFNPQTLLARVRALLRRHQGHMESKPQQLHCHRLSVDTGARTAHFNQRQISLTSREQIFLLFLLENSQQAISRDQIFDQCWHTDYLPNSRTLDQFVLTLRQKLEKELGTPRFIKTVYGVGYLCDQELLR